MSWHNLTDDAAADDVAQLDRPPIVGASCTYRKCTRRYVGHLAEHQARTHWLLLHPGPPAIDVERAQ